MYAPGEGFYATPGKGKNEVRIAYVTQPKELTRAIELLGLGIEAYNRKNGREGGGPFIIRHIVMWKFRPGTEAEQEQFLSGLRALQGVVPQLLQSEVARNVGAGNYDAVLVSEFNSLEDLEAYKNDPRHKAVSALCKSIREDRVAVDYEVL